MGRPASRMLLVSLLFVSISGLSSCESYADNEIKDRVASENVIVFALWNKAKAPFASTHQPSDHHPDAIPLVRPGLIKDFGNLISENLGKSAIYRNLPTKRVEPEMAAGRLDLVCLTHPKWWNTPEAFGWSDTLFEGSEKLIMRAEDAPTTTQFSHLAGKRIGIYRSYEYAPPLQGMIDAKEVEAVEVDNLDAALLLLRRNRIDAQVEFSRIARHQLKEEELDQELTLAPLMIDTFFFHCAVADHLTMELPAINRAIRSAKANGTLAQMLQHYDASVDPDASPHASALIKKKAANVPQVPSQPHAD